MSPVSQVISAGDRLLDLSVPRIMGILNVTPDSFSDGGRYGSVPAAIDHAASMLADGASIIDVGGESTRPGAIPVPEQQEMDRVLPVLEALATRFDAIISVDTSSPALMQAALHAGAGMLNDVRAFSRPGAFEAVVASRAAVCVMHMQGQPDTMQHAPHYEDIVGDIVRFLALQRDHFVAHGVSSSRIVLDPGFGFGKTIDQNYRLLAALDQFAVLGCPLLAGISRKSMIGEAIAKPAGQRLAGSLAAAVLALERGAAILRVHDVAETADAIKVFQYMRSAQ